MVHELYENSYVRSKFITNASFKLNLKIKDWMCYLLEMPQIKFANKSASTETL